MTDFLQRLKTHKLVQWAIAYVAFAFALIQVLGAVSDSYSWPHVVMHVAFGVLAIGFVVVLVLAWYHGERGAQRVSGPELLLIALALAIGGGLLWHFVREPAPLALAKVPASTPRAATTSAGATVASASSRSPLIAAFDPPSDSIVVLPFANLSGDKSQQYFSDGITEELTGALGQNTGLTVIAWATAARYRDSRATPAQIGKALNVAQILNGSIQRAGNTVRVSAELVSTTTGRQLWSAHYDDSLKNIFAVQDRITASIAGALKVEFAGAPAAPTANSAAHDFYLRGLAALDRFTAADAHAALDAFQQALKLDPNYADAWAGLAAAWSQFLATSTLPAHSVQSKARAAAAKALALDPGNVHALVALAFVNLNDQRKAAARAQYERALKLDPSNVDAHIGYAMLLPIREFLTQNLTAVRLDPYDAVAQNQLATSYQDLADWPRAASAAQAMIRLAPQDINGAFDLALAYAQMQRGEDAVKAFDLARPATTADRQLVDAGRLTYQALITPALRPKALAAVHALQDVGTSVFAQDDLMQLYLALGDNEAALKLLPGTCVSLPVGCVDLALNPVWAPLRGNPRFEQLVKRYETVTREARPAPALSN